MSIDTFFMYFDTDAVKCKIGETGIKHITKCHTPNLGSLNICNLTYITQPTTTQPMSPSFSYSRHYTRAQCTIWFSTTNSKPAVRMNESTQAQPLPQSYMSSGSPRTLLAFRMRIKIRTWRREWTSVSAMLAVDECAMDNEEGLDKW